MRPSDAPRKFTDKQMDTPISISEACEILEYNMRTLRAWAQQGILAISAPTTKRGDRFVTLRGVLRAEGIAFQNDKRPPNLR